MEAFTKNRNSNTPIYNIKAISKIVGLLPVTLRAWERRYGLPTPQRGQQGYRLYSEYDLLTLRWLKTQIEAGMSISRAVEYLQELRAAGTDPAHHTSVQTPPAQYASLDHLQGEFSQSLIKLDDQRASDTLRRAFSLYPMDEVLEKLMQPVLVELGEAWHRGELPITVEHFASHFCMQHLMNMISAAGAPIHRQVIIAACAPGETHQIGLLMLITSLRWRGWDVKYLGMDLPLDRYEEKLLPLNPSLLMFSATRVENANRLVDLDRVLERFPEPSPHLVLGGTAFHTLRLPEKIKAVYINHPLPEAIQAIEKILLQHR